MTGRSLKLRWSRSPFSKDETPQHDFQKKVIRVISISQRSDILYSLISFFFSRWSREDQDGKSSKVWLVDPQRRDGRDHLSPTMRQPSESTRMRSKLGLWSGYPLVCLTYSIMHPFRSVDYRKKSKLSFWELSTFSVGTWSISNKKYNKHVEAFTSTIAH